MGQQPDLRKGDQALVCACILRVSSGLWPLLRCPHPRFATPTLSLSPPLGHQCQMAATLYIRHQDSGRVSASLELRQSPGSLPSTPQQSGPWLFLVLSALPSSLRERDAQHRHPWDMSAEADTADGTKSAGWICAAPHGPTHQHRLLRCQSCRLLQSQLTLSQL